MNILAISPHADDAELWAGGSIARWRREGAKVYVASMTSSNGRKREAEHAAAALDVTPLVVQWGFEDRRLYESRDRIREYLTVALNGSRPAIVLCPSSLDMHQDHRTVYKEAFRAFRGVSTLGYDVPYNSHEHRHPFYVEITEADLDRKLAACACYESEQHKRYFDPDVIRGLATVRGAEIGVPLAEAFEMIRWIDRVQVQ